MGSLLDGMGTTDKYCEYAAELGMSALGVSNHGTINDALEFQNSCKKYNLIPVFGVEFYIVQDMNIKEKKEIRSHILTFAKNEIGFQNILKMITISNLEGFYHRPRIDCATLLAHSDNLVILTGCSSSPLVFGYGRDLLEQLVEKQKDDIFLEVMPHTHKEQYTINDICLSMSKKYGLKLVATNDSHYVKKEDAQSHEVMLAIGTRKTWDDPTRWKFNGNGFYLRDRREMTMAFVAQGQFEKEVFGEAIANTNLIVDKCSTFQWIKNQQPSLPKVPALKVMDDFEQLQKLCHNEFMHKVTDEDKDIDIYGARLEEELTLIKAKKFERYFLLVMDLLNWCRDEGIMVGPGRGSSSGSLVCYLLGITSIDPIKHGLLFFRFLSPDRTDLPDIDTDFSDIDRPRIRERLKELYGKYNVAGVSTYSILRGRGAVRDASRVFSVPLKDVAKACSIIEKKIGDDEGNDHTVEDALTNFEEGRSFYEKYPEPAKHAIALEGQYRNKGVHAAAIVVSDNDLRDGSRCGLTLDKDEELVINWSKTSIEHFGLVKIDVLGLKMLTVLKYCKQLVKQNHDIDIDFNAIDIEDKKCYVEFSKANTTGCFQLGSTNMKKFCRQLGVDNFDTLVATTALYRPGPLGSGATDIYIKRKNGSELVPKQHDLLDEITKNTFGLIIYQEQLMRIINEIAGIDWKTTDKIRKLVAKSKGVDALREYEDQFVQGCIKLGTLREEQAVTLWNDLVTFGCYAFNISHACAYSYITLWDMWMKIHYPAEFMCALLTYGTENVDDKDSYIEEAYRLGIDIRSPKIGISKTSEWVISANILYSPFCEIKGVGEKTVKQFEKLGKTNKGFVKKDDKINISQRFVNILNKIGAYEDRSLTDEESDVVSQYLGFSLVRNKLYSYKKLIKLVSTNINMSTVKEINIQETEDEYKYYFGLITEVNLTTRTGKTGKYNVASALFKDQTGSTRIAFDNELYKNQTTEVEHCDDKIIIIKANSPRKAGSLIVVDAWFSEDIISGNLDTLYLGLSERARFYPDLLRECKDCDLCNHCNGKTFPTLGTNAMIISETGVDNNDALWRELKKYDLYAKDFYVTSTIKCKVQAKAIAKKDVDCCAKWLDSEIEAIKPYIILSIGNTGLKYFTGDESGIQAKNDTCEWSERYGCWILYCISSASTYYESNIIPFKNTIKNFSNKIKNLGLIPF
jgi:DNA polymerase-3 subunit alpha